MARRWRLLPAAENADELAAKLGVAPLVAQLLINRGFSDHLSARRFLHPDLGDLHSPFLLPNLDRGLDRLVAALQGGEPILIFGDYDVDGVTAVSLLMRLLRPLAKGGLFYYVPKRLEEGYGLSLEAIKRAAKQGVKLIVTVDCGIGAATEVAAARELGVDVIVTDHHEPGPLLPEAVAIIDPKLSGSEYPFPELAGVGVAFKLGQALMEKGLLRREELYRHLDLVALGTVADVVPLLDENRILVHHGLGQLNRTEHPGLKALLEEVNLHERPVSAGQIGFIIAPRLNASGRLGDASLGVRLLLTGDPAKGREIARLLDKENDERQRIEAEVLLQAKEMIESGVDLAAEKAIVLGAPEWHPGVIGIVASRLVELYHRPVVLVALEGEEGRGSGRSIHGFNLYEGLCRCSGLLERFGGHEAAAGLTVKTARFPEFAKAFAGVAREEIAPDLLEPALRADAEISLDIADLGLAREIARLAPYGQGNPNPVLICRDAKILNCRGIGENSKHLKARVAHGGAVREAIGFNMGRILPEVSAAGQVDLAFTLEENVFNGNSQIQLNLRDLACREMAAAPPAAGQE